MLVISDSMVLDSKALTLIYFKNIFYSNRIIFGRYNLLAIKCHFLPIICGHLCQNNLLHI
jgi:hypothetical protein